MDKLEFDYLNCEQQHKQNLQSKQMNLSIDLKVIHQPEINNLTPKLFTPISATNFLNFNDELQNSSPILFKNTVDRANPFDLSFKQATSNSYLKRNLNDYNDDKKINDYNESLNTPLIDLNSFDSVQRLQTKRQENKLDLLISASNNDLINNDFNNMPYTPTIANLQNDEVNPAEQLPTNDLDNKTNTNTNKRLSTTDNTQTAYKVFLKLPDGSSVSIEQPNQTNSNQPTTTPTLTNSSNIKSKLTNSTTANHLNYDFVDYQNDSQPSLPCKKVKKQKTTTTPTSSKTTKLTNKSSSTNKGNSRKSSTTKTTKKSQQQNVIKIEKIETTTLKSIKTALDDSPSPPCSQMSNSTVEFNLKCDSLCSQSSQSSITSSFDGLSASQRNDLNDLQTCSASSSQSSSLNSNNSKANNGAKSKPGRRSKNQPKEDPSEKKIRSLERNREAASRCRTKRKKWISALEEKADELERRNKELHIIYYKLQEDLNMMKSALLNNKTTVINESCATSNGSLLTSDQKSVINLSSSSSLNQQVDTTTKPTTNVKQNFIDILLQAAKNS